MGMTKLSLTLTFSGFIQLFKKSKLTHFRCLGMGKLGVFATCLMMVVLLQVLTVDQTSANNELEDNVLRDFYEYLMQREAVEAGSHQLERRARPYQSLRLRFGKRSASDVVGTKPLVVLYYPCLAPTS